MPRLSIVIPTTRGRPLTRVLARLAAQTMPAETFEVIVVADAREGDPDAVATEVGERPFAVRTLAARVPGASAARNVGWNAAEAPLVLFMGDDTLAAPGLVGEHLAWHEEHPEETVGVLGHVRWADEIQVTPFMRWLDSGIQFDFSSIAGVEAGWGRLYTANVSLKRSMLARVGGFDEDLPFLYEDLDLGKRMAEHGFTLLYNRAAEVEHLHPVTLEGFRPRVALTARMERLFVAKHPDVPPYFLRIYRTAARQAPARGRGVRLARFVGPRVPWLGPRVWTSVDAYYRQALAPTFLAAWEESEVGSASSAA